MKKSMHLIALVCEANTNIAVGDRYGHHFNDELTRSLMLRNRHGCCSNLSLPSGYDAFSTSISNEQWEQGKYCRDSITSKYIASV